jgi:hypothetical protein
MDQCADPEIFAFWSLPGIGAATWAGLSDLQRFALVKLTRQGEQDT